MHTDESSGSGTPAASLLAIGTRRRNNELAYLLLIQHGDRSIKRLTGEEFLALKSLNALPALLKANSYSLPKELSARWQRFLKALRMLLSPSIATSATPTGIGRRLKSCTKRQKSYWASTFGMRFFLSWSVELPLGNYIGQWHNRFLFPGKNLESRFSVG